MNNETLKEQEKENNKNNKKNMAAGGAFPTYNEHPADPTDSTCERKGGRRSARRRK